jgi:hypothetical protein
VSNAIATEQVMPAGGVESVADSLIAKLEEHRELFGGEWVDMTIGFIRARRELGRARYGQELLTFNGRDPELDALQELIDLFKYLHQGQLERSRLAAENAGLRAKVAHLEDLAAAARRDADAMLSRSRWAESSLELTATEAKKREAEFLARVAELEARPAEPSVWVGVGERGLELHIDGDSVLDALTTPAAPVVVGIDVSDGTDRGVVVLRDGDQVVNLGAPGERDENGRPVACVRMPDELCDEHSSCLTCVAFPPLKRGQRA